MGYVILRSTLGTFLFTTLLALAVSVPAAADVALLGPDQIEYLDVARSLIRGDGYTLRVKAFHTGGTDVVHSGLRERPPLLPLIAAAFMAAGLGPIAVQVFNAVVASSAAGLMAAIGARLFGPAVGLASGVLVAVNPVFAERTLPVMTEAMALCLIAASVWAVLVPPPTAAWSALGGVLAGLGYVTRPTQLSALAGTALGLVVPPRGQSIRATWLLAGAVLIIAPLSIASWAWQGRWSYSGQDYLFAVFYDSDVMWDGYARPVPTAAEFIRENWAHLPGAIGARAMEYSTWLLGSRELLLPLVPGVIASLAAVCGGRSAAGSSVLLVTAGASFAGYVMIWSVTAERYLLPTLMLLTPLGVAGWRSLTNALPISSAARTTVFVALMAAIVALWAPRTVDRLRGRYVDDGQLVGVREDYGLRWTGSPSWVNDEDIATLIEWIRRETDSAAVVASVEPWPITYFADRPSTLLPRRLTAEQLASFISDYRVALLILDPRDRQRRSYRTDLERMATQGVTTTTVGRYTVFYVRPLWQR